jgi:hypothetical protein
VLVDGSGEVGAAVVGGVPELLVKLVEQDWFGGGCGRVYHGARQQIPSPVAGMCLRLGLLGAVHRSGNRPAG